MEKQRPNPDELLVKVQQEEEKQARGKLKIYLGAAPGVGKTYTMLQDAMRKKQEGVDVVVGIVESHGRNEIAELLQHFEIIPRKAQTYHGKSFTDFDLDAALIRNPSLILVDELAHTNIPGMRHAKRWQDIEEILSKGIDVYTTLNVQHIESLNDVVAQITKIHVRETVPDSVLRATDTIELVDLPTDDLLKRLAEGKVYFPEQAEIAKEKFFKKGNLIALRELALREVAKYTNAEVFSYRQAQGIENVWPTREKILACIGYRQSANKVIRAALRMAEYFQTELWVIYVDSPRIHASNMQRDEAILHLRFAETLGAKTRIITAIDIVEAIIDFARSQNITQIVIGKRTRPWWKNMIRRNLAFAIIKKSEEINVHVITEESVHATLTPPLISKKNKVNWKSYAYAIGVIGLTTLINFLLFPYLNGSDLIMIYVLASTFVALHADRKPAALASVLSVLAYDFFFVPPYYSFTVENGQYLLTILVMLFITQTIGYLAVLLGRQVNIAHQAEHYVSSLYSLSHQLARSRGSKQLLHVGTQYIAEAFDCKVRALLTPDDQQKLSDKERGIAQWVYDLRQNAGWGTNTLSFLEVLYIPLVASQGVVGVLRIHPNHPEHLYTPDEMRLLESVANQIALALEVDKLNN